MRVKVLVVEDNDALYEGHFFRLASRLLPMDEIELTRASSISAAIEALSKAWDFIIMDYQIGTGAMFEGTKIGNGADLVRLRRRLEEGPKLSPANIVGFSSNGIGNQLMLESGAAGAFLKLNMETLCDYLRGNMKNER